MTALEIAKMSKKEKLLLLEEIWEDLSRIDTEVIAPVWHEKALKETEERISQGLETPVDWKKAKDQLRSRFA